jgi:NADPH2:quinone reductase
LVYLGITPVSLSPVAGQDEKFIHVRASVLENFDKMVASGKYYGSKQMFPEFPAIIGHGGIGMTEDGQLVSFGMMRSPYGSFAEKTVARYSVPIPEGVDAAVAAALPASILTSYLPLKYTAKLEQDETVLVNGATGVSGKIAVQLAKMLGAKRVVGTGRNETSLKLLEDLGTDAVIDLKQNDEELLASLKREAAESGYDVVIDFIWGHPAEIIMKSFVPKEVGFAKKKNPLCAHW